MIDVLQLPLERKVKVEGFFGTEDIELESLKHPLDELDQRIKEGWAVLAMSLTPDTFNKRLIVLIYRSE